MNRKIRMAFAAILFGVTSLSSVSTLASPDLNPSMANPNTANSVVVISKSTRHVNVFSHDTVLFKIDGKQFAVKFDGTQTVYELAQLVPADMAVPKVKIYVSPNPDERGSGVL